jgi:SET domain-containing protein
MIRLRVAPSQIAGKGLFAAQPIKKGTYIVRYIGEKIPKAESQQRLAQGNVYIFSLNEQYDIDGKLMKNIARYINHSCDPNCVVKNSGRAIWIVAARDIQDGEELSYNYGYTLEDYGEQACHCGAKQCCGYILDRQYWKFIKRTTL